MIERPIKAVQHHTGNNQCQWYGITNNGSFLVQAFDRLSYWKRGKQDRELIGRKPDPIHPLQRVTGLRLLRAN